MDAPEREFKNYLLLEVVQKGRHRGSGYPKIVTNGDIRGEGACSNGDVTTVFF